MGSLRVLNNSFKLKPSKCTLVFIFCLFVCLFVCVCCLFLLCFDCFHFGGGCFVDVLLSFGLVDCFRFACVWEVHVCIHVHVAPHVSFLGSHPPTLT